MTTDVKIKQDVLDELLWDPEVDDTKIGVAVTDGAVTLSGRAATYAQKLATKRAAERVNGVRALVDKIEVTLADRHRTSDDDLAQRISHVLSWNVSAPASVKAEVEGGIVTLKGEVDWPYQRMNIHRNIEHVSGVMSIIDLMRVKPRVSTPDVQNRIADALKRHAEVESSTITVVAQGGTVTLSGTVDSLAEMRRVERAAWAASGVTKIIDNLKVA